MTIGLIGCHPGCGVTHFAIALSSFCGSKLRKKTALLEMHGREELSALNLTDKNTIHFLCHGADYYPCFNSEKLPYLLNCGYEYFILDFGNIQEADRQEFLRCDRKLVLGSMVPWKIQSFEHFFTTSYNEEAIGRGFTYLVQSGSYKNIVEFSKRHHITMQSIPFIKNPFRIGKEHFSFLQEVVS